MTDVTVDSGMDAQTVETAEWLWTQMPILTRWHNQPTYAKALVCRLVRQIEDKAIARHRANHAQGEAVAWRYERKAPWPAMYYHEERAPEYLSGDTDYPWTETPLYTHPPAQDVAALVSALGEARRIIAEIDDYMKRPGRGDWGEECACCMGELLDDDRDAITKIDTALANYGAKP